MDTCAPAQRRLLIIEANPDIRDLLNVLLNEEGYAVHFASSLFEALPLVDEWVFQLILADLFIDRSRHSLAQANTLRLRARLTPMGLMTTQNLSAAEVKRLGFAFLLHMPFDLEHLLATIAATLQSPLDQEQQRQAQVVERFFEALNARSLETLLALCTDDLMYYPPAYSAFTRAGKLTGKAAYRDYLTAVLHRLTDARCEDVTIYARPRGLAAQYRSCWITYKGIRQCLAAVLLFHFRDEHISQIGFRFSEERWRALAGARAG
jgi:CheY-like chemotaxis protein